MESGRHSAKHACTIDKRMPIVGFSTEHEAHPGWAYKLRAVQRIKWSMIRIFTSLAITAVLLMAAALLLGLYVGDIHGTQDADTLRWAMVHRLIGTGAAL